MSYKYEYEKYEFTGDTRTHQGVQLHRIRALRDFGEVRAGDLGGWIEHEGNLSHDGLCWVADEAQASGFCEISEDAIVFEHAVVKDYVRVRGKSTVAGDSQIFGYALIGGEARISGNVRVHRTANITDFAYASGKAEITGSMYGFSIADGNAKVLDRSVMLGHSRVHEDAVLTGVARLEDFSYVADRAKVHGYARLTGHACAIGDARVHGNALLEDNRMVSGVVRNLDTEIHEKTTEMRMQFDEDCIPVISELLGYSIRPVMDYDAKITYWLTDYLTASEIQQLKLLPDIRLEEVAPAHDVTSKPSVSMTPSHDAHLECEL